MSDASTTFIGHIVPGTMFLLWGLWWFGAANPSTKPFTAAWEPIVIIAGLLIGVFIELLAGAWHLTDTSVMNFQHVTMYVGFAIPAGTYLLARRGLVPDRLPSLTLGGAFAATGLLFVAHGSPTPVSDTIHVLLAVLLFGCAIVSVAEGIRPSQALATTRCWLAIAIGTWFCEAGWILAYSHYDQNSAMVVLRVRMFFIWHLTAAGILLLAVHLAVRPGSRQPAGQLVS